MEIVTSVIYAAARASVKPRVRCKVPFFGTGIIITPDASPPGAVSNASPRA